MRNKIEDCHQDECLVAHDFYFGPGTEDLQKPGHTQRLLDGVSPQEISLSAEERLRHESMFWGSICSEDDSQHLYRRIRGAGFSPSPALERFLPGWLGDEFDHAMGFIRIYSLIYGTPHEQINQRLADREPDFRAIEEFLHDEFSLCLLLAYDELVTAQVYYLSTPFYEGLGAPALPAWLRQVKRDEVRHYANIMQVARLAPECRSESAERILRRIVEVDTSQAEYRGTFVLDHACPEFPFTGDELLALCDRVILRKLHGNN